MRQRRPCCTSATRVTASFILGFLAATAAAASASSSSTSSADAAASTVPKLPIVPPLPIAPSASTREFALRHIFHHGTYRYPNLHRRLDVPAKAPVWVAEDEQSSDRELLPPLRIRAEPMNIQRLVDRRRDTIDGILDWARTTGTSVHLAASDWTIDELPGPNVSDKETVLSFARMASNAYILEPNTGEWEDVGSGFNYTEDFGWQSDGLRGHIFADTTNQTIVIGLKGTSPAVFDGSGTTTNDKVNDNLFFSCCCGQGGQYLWHQVCDCQTSAYTCNSTCLVTALRAKNRYYYAAQDLYHNVTALYPDADIWMAGHSLGGAVSSFLGLTYGHPAVTFEAVPDAMPAARLGLPTPPGHQVGALQKRTMTGGFHFGHTADPVYMGQCNKASSSCTFGGYAMQSVCHTGYKCVYDTVKDLGWRVGIGTHKIVEVIRDVLEKYDAPAKCEQYVNCTDCFPWQFYESNGTERTSISTTVSSTRTLSRTRTETCKTPGWWGCLDEDPTTSISTTSQATSSSLTTTTTCKTPGWFGCKDEFPTTTTTTTTKSSHPLTSATPAPAPTITTALSRPTTSATSSCKTPGWFGCNDPTTSVTTSIPPSSSPSSITSETCRTKGWFGFVCYDQSGGSSASDSGGERMEM